MIAVLVIACGTRGEEGSPPADSSEASPIQCPPLAPYGRSVGDRAVDIAAADCTGVTTSIHGLCGKPALIVNWYGWCASCEDNAELARAIAAKSAASADLSVVIVLDEDPLAHPVDADFCAAYAAANPTTAIYWMDPGKALEAYGKTDLVLVLERDGTIAFNRETSTASAIQAAVDGVLSE